MPHPDYSHRLAVEVACSGPAERGAAIEGPIGPIGSKAGAHLAYAIADVRAWSSRTYGPPPMGEDCLRSNITLEEATRADVLDAMAEASARLNAHNDHSRGGTLDFYYSGHGLQDGALSLADGALDADELAEAWIRGNTHRSIRHVRFVLDCCYAGMLMARLLLHPGHWSSYVLRDGWAASLPSEEAFELPTLGHGVLTYLKTRPDPLEIVDEWRASGHQPSEADLRNLRRINRETAQYLTNGSQHALDLVNGHAITLFPAGRGDVELGDSQPTPLSARSYDDGRHRPGVYRLALTSSTSSRKRCPGSSPGESFSLCTTLGFTSFQVLTEASRTTATVNVTPREGQPIGAPHHQHRNVYEQLAPLDHTREKFALPLHLANVISPAVHLYPLVVRAKGHAVEVVPLPVFIHRHAASLACAPALRRTHLPLKGRSNG